MTTTFLFVFCAGLVVIALVTNYILVTRQERRQDIPPRWTPEAVDWDTVDVSTIRALMASGKKIEAIKHYRELTGAGLKEAKDAVEFVMLNPTMVGEKKKAPTIDLVDAPGIRDLLEVGRENEAVDVYRKFAGVDEYTARDAVERIKAEMRNTGNPS